MNSSRRKMILAAAGVPLLHGFNAAAQNYPDKPTKMIVAFLPGNGTDIIARLISQKMERKLGQSVYVENRAGAGGTIGTTVLARSEPDGYSLTLATNATLITSPLLLERPPYDANQDFTPIGGIARTPLVIYTSSREGSPKTFEELVARTKQGGSSFASAGVGTIGHLTSEVVVKRLGLPCVHIPYKGAPPALTDVSRGEVLFGTETPAATRVFVYVGSIRPLAVTGATRLSTMPNVPTLAELGLKDVDLNVWWAVMAPRNLPSSVAQRLEETVASLASDAELLQRMKQLELEPMFLGKEKLGAFIQTEYPFWRDFLSKSNIKLS